MTRIILILLIGLCFEALGVVCLKKGVMQVGGPQKPTVTEIVQLVKRSVTNPNILLGIFLEAIFFGCLLVLLGKSDISFIWPLTSLSFVFSTFAAMWFLHEHVSNVRWLGIMLIVLGAGFISYSEHSKPLPTPAEAQLSTTK